MILEKLFLSAYIKNYHQIVTAKKHLLGSLREMLLAATITVDIVKKTTSQNPVLSRVYPLQQTVKNVDDLLKFSLKRIGSGQLNTTPLHISQIKNQVIESIIGVIDEEIDVVPKNLSNRNQIKIEALETVKKTLLNHLNPGNSKAHLQELTEELSQAANS